ncbi:hypothetical protein HY641_01415 [Candidatus Woesearchaeota archaeon]|nr:hypothetical protein [Candidatus Woesearchaeota archaeon]
MLWKCGHCGFIVEGKTVPFENCPVCGYAKAQFKQIQPSDIGTLDKVKNKTMRFTVLKAKGLSYPPDF